MEPYKDFKYGNTVAWGELKFKKSVGRQDQIYRQQTYLLWKKEEWIYILGKKKIRLKNLGKESEHFSPTPLKD